MPWELSGVGVCPTDFRRIQKEPRTGHSPFCFLFSTSLLHSSSLYTHTSTLPLRSTQHPSPLYTITVSLKQTTKCPATTPTSSCAASNPASPSAVSATNAMANAPSAIPTCAQPPSSASATNAPSETTRISALSAVARESAMPSIASSVRVWRRIGMGVRRL